MNVYRFLEDLPELRNPVLTIGTFDGVHLGHVKVLEELRSLATERNGETVVLTFHPHPRLVLDKNHDVQLISTLDERIDLLERAGLDHLIIGTFDEAFSETDPETYIRQFLVEKIRPSAIVIGHDHRFGQGRAGDIHLLRKLAPECGFEVYEIEANTLDEIRVSSTKIRQSIADGDINLANRLLGHPFSFSGNVIRGEGIGHELGYPTANIFVEDKTKLLPGEGVYATHIYIKRQRFDGMLYIGNRPTFKGREKAIEVNIFDIRRDLYNLVLRIDVVARIRADHAFNSAQALIAQIDQDRDEAMRLLGRHSLA